jgi:hypothetical protein
MTDQLSAKDWLDQDMATSGFSRSPTAGQGDGGVGSFYWHFAAPARSRHDPQALA